MSSSSAARRRNSSASAAMSSAALRGRGGPPGLGPAAGDPGPLPARPASRVVDSTFSMCGSRCGPPAALESPALPGCFSPARAAQTIGSCRCRFALGAWASAASSPSSLPSSSSSSSSSAHRLPLPRFAPGAQHVTHAFSHF